MLKQKMSLMWSLLVVMCCVSLTLLLSLRSSGGSHVTELQYDPKVAKLSPSHNF